MFYRKAAFLLAISVITSALFADTKSEIDSILKDPILAHAEIGVHIYSLKTHKTIYERNADFQLSPASNLKLFTAASALELLGPKYQYITLVQAQGTITDGVLHGDLLLYGGGDPLLEPKDYEIMADTVVKELKLKRILGSVKYDDTLWDDVRMCDGWSADDLRWYYGTEISPLMVSRNAVAVYITPGSGFKAPTIIRTSPEFNPLIITNSSLTSSPKATNNLIIEKGILDNTLTLSGSFPAGAIEDHIGTFAIHDASRWVASMFNAALLNHAVSIAGVPTPGHLSANLYPTVTLKGSTIADVLPHFLKPSDNMVGECLLKMIGTSRLVQGSTASGLVAENSFLRSAGVDVDSLDIHDGSGLSRKNGITPRAVTSLLNYMSQSKNFDLYRNSMSVAGVDGTIRNRFQNSPVKSHFWGKTGTTHSVCSLSGYAELPSGEMTAVSILVNHYGDNDSAVREIQDKIVNTLYKETPKIMEGQQAPDFTLQDQNGKNITLSEFKGTPVVLYFYPKDDTPGCTTEACAFRDDRADYEKAGAKVIGVSPDNIQSHQKFANKYNLEFTLAADPDHRVCELYDVWKEKMNYGKKYFGVERTTFIIDKAGKITKIFPKVKVDGHAKEVLDEIKKAAAN